MAASGPELNNVGEYDETASLRYGQSAILEQRRTNGSGNEFSGQPRTPNGSNHAIFAIQWNMKGNKILILLQFFCFVVSESSEAIKLDNEVTLFTLRILLMISGRNLKWNPRRSLKETPEAIHEENSELISAETAV